MINIEEMNLLMLREDLRGTGEEILIKRDALDLLLVMSKELVYPQTDIESSNHQLPVDRAQFA